MVEFCPRCEKMLVPTRTEKGIYLVCKACGYKKAASSKEGYKLVHEVGEEKRRTTIIVEGAARQKEKEEEREMMQEYYDVFLESFMETQEEEGGESYE